MLGEAFGAPGAPASLTPCTRPALCIIIDGRGGSRAELLRLWLGAMEELLALRPEPLPDLSIVTVHEDFYESSLPLGQHTLGAVQAALGRLEHEMVLAPMGLAGGPWPDGDGLLRGGGILPEHAMEIPGGMPLRPRGEAAGQRTPAKRPRKVAETPARRLFAVGEDAALAALRSAAAQMVRPGAAAAASAAAREPRSDRRLELWTAVPERLAAAAGRQSVPLRGGPADGLEVLIVAAVGAAGGAQQRAACARNLAAELPEAFGVRVLPLTPAAFGRQVRTHVGREMSLRLLLPASAAPRELQLTATAAVLLRPSWQLASSRKACLGAELRVICRVPAAGVSCELMYGVPLLAGASPHDSAAAAGALRALVRELTKREECLLLSAALSPLSLAPSQCGHHFLGFPAKGRQPLLVLRGVASADVWQPGAMLVESCSAGKPAQPPAVPCAGDWPSFDPYDLRPDRAAGEEGWGGW